MALGNDGRGEDRFTSRDMIETEQRLARETQALADREHHRVAESGREHAIVSAERRGLALSAEQRSAFEHITDAKGPALRLRSRRARGIGASRRKRPFASTSPSNSNLSRAGTIR
ncbi:hypothetical protein IAG41_21870 [Sphingomonas sp. JC676]|uniref:hypothetical protein n=1 Tax=Sphingomonas sp. JC676 TaxID=2768065 RepID=UPI001657BD7F|nr:hypothetical protein [Sphingomonas sp. JC676]MBC9035045.1 hypothetical protein [Sphingomonas sp. JC676]